MPFIDPPLPPTSAPVGANSVPIPHWNFPLTFNTTTGVGVVQQDTLDEVFANVQMIAVCPQGACPELPDTGVPPLVFGQAPLDPQPVVDAIQAQEPRATETALSQAVGDPDLGSWLIALTTQYPGGDR